MSVFPNHWLLGVAVVASLAAGLLVFSSRNSVAGLASALRRVVLALLLVLIAVRPAIGSSTTTSWETGVDLVIMIDTTASMAAEDHEGGKPRLVGVREDLTSLLSSVHGSRVSIIVFDNEARTVLPFTTDTMAAISLVDAIGWREAVKGSGSDIAVGTVAARAALEASKSERPEVSRHLVYVGDGEQTKPSEPGSFADLAPLIDGGLVLGYGSVTGGPMLTHEGSNQYVMDGDEVALSRLDHQRLGQIAKQLGVTYQHRASSGDLTLDVSGEELVPVDRNEPRGVELYWLFAAVALVILGIELWELIGRLHRAKVNLL